MGGAPQYGVGGDKMRAAGFRAWYDSRELSVRGYVEVLTHLPRLLSFRKDLITRFGDSMPQVFVGRRRSRLQPRRRGEVAPPRAFRPFTS